MKWFTSFWDWLLSVFQKIIDFPYTVFDSVLTFAENQIASFDVPFLELDIFGFLPDAALYVLKALDFPICLSIMFSAMGVRFLLNLIPSWGTRV